MDGSIYGPYTAKEILDLDLLDDILVTEESMNGQWLPAKEFDFHDMFLKESIRINEDGTITRGDKGEPHYVEVHHMSDLSQHSPTTQELARWNWGAFMFNWLWGICNGVYWPLLLILINLIPYVGAIVTFGLCVYLGVKGTEMAWNAKEWPSWESFQETQHRWAVAILWVFGIGLVICIITGLAIS